MLERDSRPMARKTSENLLHGRRLADDAHLGLLNHRLSAACLLPARQGSVDLIHGLVHVEGFGQVFESTHIIGFHGTVEIRVGGHDDHRQTRIDGLQPRQQGDTVQARHADIGDDHIRPGGLQGIQEFSPAVETLHLEAVLLQRLLQDPAHGRIIVNHPYECLIAHCSSSKGR